MKKLSFLLFICIGCFLQQVMAQQSITINNIQPRISNLNKPVDAHDGRVIQFGNTYYWYGTQYGNTNGFTNANTFVCYSSTNLQQWKFEGEILSKKINGICYRPHVVYNAATKKYVLWYNWYPSLWAGQFSVAVADKPTGPFVVENDNVTVKHSALGVGDLGVFVDDDGKAYLSYNTINGHKVSVEALDENYTKSTLQGSEFIANNCEAGAMFKRNGIYYLLTDYTCCFCTQGSGAKVFTANTPLGKYTYRQNINRYPGTNAAVLKDGEWFNNAYESFYPKEANGIEIWWPQNQLLSSFSLYQFTGDRKGQCGEVSNPVLHQPIQSTAFTIQYFKDGEWINLPYKTKQTAINTNITYQFSFSAIATNKIKIIPVYTDTVQPIHISEIAFLPTVKNTQIFKTGKIEGKPIIAAQQTFVMPLQTTAGIQYIWMGDLWGSALNNIKGNDFQYWSAPLQFYKNGLIKELSFLPIHSIKK
jgi:hypothetical protein